MKCALELTELAKRRHQEILVEKMLKAKKEREEEVARTISYCEKIGITLENLANDGRYPKTSIYVDAYENRPLKSTCSDYADGRVSYRIADKKIDIELMTKWFNKYCFAVKILDFPHWRHGCGSCSGYEIQVFPIPACKE